MTGTVRVGYLGPEGSFSHEACLKWVREGLGVEGAPGGSAAGGAAEGLVTSGRPVELAAMPSIDALFEAAGSGRLEQGVCPLENSLEGPVTPTIDLWLHQSALYQVGEVVVAVEHQLLVRPGTPLSAVEVVLSHPHALAQCRRTLRALLPAARPEPIASTAEGARQVALSQRPWAAVAGPAAAARYGLEAAFAPLQDGSRNATRFGVFGYHLPGPTGDDRTSLAVGSLDDRPGLLRDMLAEFADRGINLTRIESRPSREGLGSYLFLIDLKGHARDPAVREALRGVRRMAGYLRLLGSYRRAAAAP